MTKELSMPRTVGELIEILKEFPESAQLSVFVSSVCDNGSVWPNTSERLAVTSSDGADYVELTFADGYSLPKE